MPETRWEGAVAWVKGLHPKEQARVRGREEDVSLSLPPHPTLNPLHHSLPSQKVLSSHVCVWCKEGGAGVAVPSPPLPLPKVPPVLGGMVTPPLRACIPGTAHLQVCLS